MTTLSDADSIALKMVAGTCENNAQFIRELIAAGTEKQAGDTVELLKARIWNVINDCGECYPECHCGRCVFLREITAAMNG